LSGFNIDDKGSRSDGSSSSSSPSSSSRCTGEGDVPWENQIKIKAPEWESSYEDKVTDLLEEYNDKVHFLKDDDDEIISVTSQQKKANDFEDLFDHHFSFSCL
jgi:hypothetical protein